MSIQLNHTIVAAKDRQVSAEFLADLLGLEVGAEMGPFLPVELDNGVTLDFAQAPTETEITPQHYAFLVSEDEFDAALDKIKRYRVTYWADPRRHGEGEINHHDGGRGVYFCDPSGHYMELITVPYGGWA